MSTHAALVREVKELKRRHDKLGDDISEMEERLDTMKREHDEGAAESERASKEKKGAKAKDGGEPGERGFFDS